MEKFEPEEKTGLFRADEKTSSHDVSVKKMKILILKENEEAKSKLNFVLEIKNNRSRREKRPVREQRKRE